MDKFRLMKTFIAIIDHGSLSAASVALQRSVASVTRGLSELEQDLGVRLLNRNTRTIKLTEEGSEYLYRARRILSDIAEAEQALDAKRQSLEGTLKITAPVKFGREQLSSVVTEFMQQHPNVSVDLMLFDRMVDLIEEGFDVAVRIGQLADSNLIARPMGKLRTMVCASPELVEKMGLPETPVDLKKWPAGIFSPRGNQWQFKEKKFLTLQEMTCTFRSNQIDILLDAAIAGLCVVQLYSYQVAEALKQGKLVALLTEFEIEPVPVQFVYPHHRLLSHRVKSFMEWSGDRIREKLLQLRVAS